MIEPFPSRLPKALLEGTVYTDASLECNLSLASTLQFNKTFMERSLMGTYTSLEANDILHIDSSHMMGLQLDQVRITHCCLKLHMLVQRVDLTSITLKSLIWSTPGMQYMPDKENAVSLASNSTYLNIKIYRFTTAECTIG